VTPPTPSIPRLLRTLAALLFIALAGCATPTATPGSAPDATPRIAIISAFPAELALLRSHVEQQRTQSINGVEFTTGTLQGKPVVLFLSGVSMTNAAMNTQLVLDRFKVSHLVFSGIAGGVNPALKIGDVVVAQRWGQYLEVLAARETSPGQYRPPSDRTELTLPNFGMFYPRAVGVRSATHQGVEKKFWFDADPALLAIAERAANVTLQRCDAERHCLAHEPHVVVGGNGVSGQAFVDNAALREYAFRTFQANVLDMETAATAMVAYSNGVPFIAFRSLSDLAGGGEGENEMGTFFRIAADNSARVLLAFLAAWR
jgi:adenosylhomocysteine nucleosidase